jgi:transposase
VARSVRAFIASGLEYAAIDTMPDSQLVQALAGKEIPEKSARYQELSQRFPAMVVELKKKGVTLQWLWELYIQEHPGGYQCSQYCLNFHRWRKEGHFT